MIDCRVSGPEALCEELVSGVKISQSFHCKIDNLCCIEVKFGTYNRRNFGHFLFNLRFKGQNSDVIRVVEQLSHLRDNAYHAFKFSPIRISSGREFIFSLESPACLHGNNVVIWKSVKGSDGQRFLNERKVSGTVCFRTKCTVSKTVVGASADSFTIPALSGVQIEQKFSCKTEIVDALSLDLDNYGSIGGSILVDLREMDGDCLFRTKILSEQISNGFPLLLPLPPTKTKGKTFVLSLSSKDGGPGNAVGVKILKNEKSLGELKINNVITEGEVSFSVRSAEPSVSKPLISLLSPDVKIMFNQPRPLEVLPSSAKKIGGLVDIITLNYNRADLLFRCYQSIVKNTVYPNWKWHICDNGSTDNSTDMIARFADPRVTITRRSDNSLGFGEANNQIFKSKAQGEYVLFLNNDVTPKKNWLTAMTSILENDPDVGVVGARLYYPNGTPQHLGIIFQHNKTPVNISQFFMGPKLKHFPDVDRCFQAVTGACLLMRRADFEAIGGFPGGYDYGYEDVDLCLTVYNALNKKVVLSSGAIAVHDEAATSRRVKRSGRSSDVTSLKKKWSCDPDAHLYLNNFRHNVYVGPKVEKPIFSIITCVTQPAMWMENIIHPNRNDSRFIEFKPVFNLVENLSITVAYNRELSSATGKYLIFCHQDLRFYPGWFETLGKYLKGLPNGWGVVGVAGWSEDGVIRGGLRIPEGIWSPHEGEVQTVDECFLVVQRGLAFDEKIVEPHLYGVDICLESLSRGFKNYALQLYVEHRESGAHPEDWIQSYYRALRQLKTKWSPRFPTIRATTCVLRQGYPDVVGVKPPRN